MILKFRLLLICSLLLLLSTVIRAQNYIHIDTTQWDITARSYVIEKYKGKDAIYLQAGSIKLKDKTFLNGTIEFDMYLKNEQSFPGLNFRINNNRDAEHWYIRPHLSGKPDANQAAPLTNGISPWQLYFGPRYSFPYTYKYNDWTHVKIVVNAMRAQVYLDYAEKPNLSWHLFHPAKEGGVSLRGGNASGMHIANISINKNEYIIKDFESIERKPIEGLISEWEVSDMFEEKLLDNPNNLRSLIKNRTWQGKIQLEEGTAANISRKVYLFDGSPGNTVFAKIVIESDKNQLKYFDFGYSDRVVAILNGNPIYRGTNRWRSRDYRYLGTIGLFDGIYLNLKKGKNTLLMAVSEDFGGWLITGKFKDENGITIN